MKSKFNSFLTFRAAQGKGSDQQSLDHGAASRGCAKSEHQECHKLREMKGSGYRGGETRRLHCHERHQGGGEFQSRAVESEETT